MTDQRTRDIAISRGYYVEPDDQDDNHVPTPTEDLKEGLVTGLIGGGALAALGKAILSPKPAPPKVSTPLESLKVGDKVDIWNSKKGTILYKAAVILAVDAKRGEARVQGDQGSKNININDYSIVKRPS